MIHAGNIGKVRNPHNANMGKVKDLQGKVIEGWMM